MFCVKCGTKLEENAKFCVKCGKEVVKDIKVKKTTSDQPIKKQPEPKIVYIKDEPIEPLMDTKTIVAIMLSIVTISIILIILISLTLGATRGALLGLTKGLGI